MERERWPRRYLGIPIETPGVISQRYQEKEHHLIMLSGCDMDKLIELFAAGWTLQPPNYERKPLASLFDENKGEENVDL